VWGSLYFMSRPTMPCFARDGFLRKIKAVFDVNADSVTE
jgi:predicted metal-binding transcription factor (methanogenesis marker protein 9)